MSIKKSEWEDWKQNDITRAFYQACRERTADTIELLAAGAGLDQASDNFYRGFISAYREMEGFTVEDMADD